MIIKKEFLIIILVFVIFAYIGSFQKNRTNDRSVKKAVQYCYKTYNSSNIDIPFQEKMNAMANQEKSVLNLIDCSTLQGILEPDYYPYGGE